MRIHIDYWNASSSYIFAYSLVKCYVLCNGTAGKKVHTLNLYWNEKWAIKSEKKQDETWNRIPIDIQ